MDYWSDPERFPNVGRVSFGPQYVPEMRIDKLALEVENLRAIMAGYKQEIVHLNAQIEFLKERLARYNDSGRSYYTNRPQRDEIDGDS
jgi:cell division protein FtsB